MEQKKEQSAALSEDTDCDGSSLPEDSPVVQTWTFTLSETALNGLRFPF